MRDRCLVHGCSNRSDMSAGISAHFSPAINVVEIRAHSPRELKSERNACGGCVQVHFAEKCFSRAFHMEGCRWQLIPGSIYSYNTEDQARETIFQTTTPQGKPCSILSKLQYCVSHEVSFFVEVTFMFIP